MNSELTRRVGNLERALDAIHDVARAVLVPRDPVGLYRTIYRALGEVIPYDAGYIDTYNAANDTLITVYGVDEGLEEFGTEPWDYRKSETTAWIVANRQPIRFGDLNIDRPKLFPNSTWSTFGNPDKISRAWMSMPMLIGDTLIGIINVQSYQADLYGPFEEHLLRVLANPIALALENGRLIAELEESVAGLEIPLIPFSDNILIVPLVGVLDQARWEGVTETVLATISGRGTEQVLLDGSGIISFDTHTIQALTTLVHAIDLIGAKSMLIGLRPSLIEGLIRAGVHLSSIRTTRDLPAALALIGG